MSSLSLMDRPTPVVVRDSGIRVPMYSVSKNKLLTVRDRHVIVCTALNWFMCRRKYSGVPPHVPVVSTRP